MCMRILDIIRVMYKYMHIDMETKTQQFKHRLKKEGWFLARHGGGHDIYRHPRIKGIITLPRHRTVTVGVARSIAKKAGWPDD